MESSMFHANKYQCADSNKSTDIKENDSFFKITNIKFSQNPVKLKVQSMEYADIYA
jgi:hypothetical protein